jgi:hypothetical protein
MVRMGCETGLQVPSIGEVTPFEWARCAKFFSASRLLFRSKIPCSGAGFSLLAKQKFPAFFAQGISL